MGLASLSFGPSLTLSTFSTAAVATGGVVLRVVVGVGVTALLREAWMAIEEDRYDNSYKALTTEEERQKQSEYEVMKRLTQMPPEPGNDCSSLAKRIHHAEAVLKRYKAWDAKWFPGRHAYKIKTWERRLEKLKQKHKQRCSGK